MTFRETATLRSDREARITLTPELAQSMVDHLRRKMTNEDRVMGRGLLRMFRETPAQDRSDCLCGHRLWVDPAVPVDGVVLNPVIAYNAWIPWAVAELGEPVAVIVAVRALGQTFPGERRQKGIIGRGASEIKTSYITDYVSSIIEGTEHGLSKDWRQPEWFPPGSGRIGMLSALLTSIHCWGDKAPDVWTNIYSVHYPKVAQRKLTLEFLTSQLPAGQPGLTRLMQLKDAVDWAWRLAERQPYNDILPLDPIPGSGMVWACYARHPLDPSAPPPLRSWLIAAANQDPIDSNGAPTLMVHRLREEMGNTRSRRVKGVVQPAKPRRYQDVAVRLVGDWVHTMRRVLMARIAGKEPFQIDPGDGYLSKFLG